MFYKNSIFFSRVFYLILSHVSLAISGVLFWYVAARLYSVEEIGMASVLISCASLLIFFASLGITPTFMRFLPENKDKGRLFGALFSCSLFLIILFSLMFLIGVNLFLPRDHIFRISFYPVFFFVFVIAMHIFRVLHGFYMGLKSTDLVLFKNIIQNFLRIGMLFLTVSLGGFGIFSSNCFAAVIATVILIGCFIKKFPSIKLKFKFDFSVLKELLPFSLANFLNSISLYLPGMFFPPLIFFLFSKRAAGIFYIPWMMFFVYCNFILAVNHVFLMHASSGENISKPLKKTLLLSFLLGIIGFVFFTFWGDKVLSIFKEDFSMDSFVILKVLFCSIFFFIINQIYITLLNIRKAVREVGMVSAVTVSGMIIFSVLFLPRMKSEGIAYAWLVSNFIGNIYVLIVFLKNPIKMFTILLQRCVFGRMGIERR